MVTVKELYARIDEIDKVLEEEYKDGETVYASQLECQLETLEDAICEIEANGLNSVSKLKVSFIEWDVDEIEDDTDIEEEPIYLPTTVVININTDNIHLLDGERRMDYLSNEYGYCICSCSTEFIA